MKKSMLILLTIGLLLTVACRQNQKEKMDAPGPVEESDKSRYNLNAGDEVMYDAIDSATVDSLRKDSIAQRK